METWLVCPAKKDSKGLPGKNTMAIGGQPGINYLSNQIRKCKYINKLLAVSNDTLFMSQAASLGFETVKVAEHFFNDEGISTATVVEAVKVYSQKHNGVLPDLVIEAYASTPVRPQNCFNLALEKFFLSKKATSIITVEKPARHPALAFIGNKDHCVANDVVPYVPREKLPVYLQPSGAMFGMKWDTLVKAKKENPNSYYGDFVLYIEFPTGTTVDIDSPYDLEMAEFTLSRQANDRQRIF